MPFALAAMVVSIAALSACGGGGGGGGGASAIPAAPTLPSGAQANTTLTLSLGTSTSSAGRSAQSLPANSAAIAVYTYLSNASAPSTPTLVASLVSAPPCTPATGPRTCSITFNAPVSTASNPTVVAVQVYDTAPTGCTNGTNCTLNGGNVLSGGIASQSITANGANSVTIALNNVSQQVSISGSGPVPLPTLAPIIGGGSGVVGGSVNVTVPGSSGLSNGTVVTVGGVAPAQLAVQISSGVRHAAQYTSGAGNTYVYGINFSLNPSQTLTVPLQIGASFQVNSTLGAKLSSKGTLNVAQFNGTTYVDVGTVAYTYAAPTLTITDTNTSGIELGTPTGNIYVIYLAAPSASTLTPLQGVLNVYTLPVNGSTDPTPPNANDPATFNSAALAYGQASPPVASLLGTQTAFNGVANFLSTGFDFTASGQQPVGVTKSCGTSFTYGGFTCAADGTGAHEWIAVQTWPLYIGAVGSSNFTAGSYTFAGGADDSVWLVLAANPFTFAQPASFAGASPLTAGSAIVKRSGVNSYAVTTGSTVSFAAGVGTANLYWITMEYVELVGGGASLSYAWRPSGSETFTQIPQGVVYGQVTHAGLPAGGQTVTVAGKLTLTTDSNGFYGYNVLMPTGGAAQAVTVSAGASSMSLTAAPGQALRQDFSI